MALFSDKPMEQWVREYERSHTDPRNKLCHVFGIPMIVISIAIGICSIWLPMLLWPAIFLFVLGWVLQFVGHYYEQKLPEFFHDLRFLFVGLRWWLHHVSKKH